MRPSLRPNWLCFSDLFSAHALLNCHAITLGTTLKTGRLCFSDELPVDNRIILIKVKEINEFTPQMSPEVEAAVVTRVD